MAVLFEFPKKAAFNRIVPKSKFYEQAKPTKTVKDKFVSQVAQVVWSYKRFSTITSASTGYEQSLREDVGSSAWAIATDGRMPPRGS